jgi:hypothetical protein
MKAAIALLFALLAAQAAHAARSYSQASCWLLPFPAPVQDCLSLCARECDKKTFSSHFRVPDDAGLPLVVRAAYLKRSVKLYNAYTLVTLCEKQLFSEFLIHTSLPGGRTKKELQSARSLLET